MTVRAALGQQPVPICVKNKLLVFERAVNSTKVYTDAVIS